MCNPQTWRTSWFEIGVFLLLDGLHSRLTSSIYSWFGIRVFLLLDRFPTKADELHLPGFGVRVVLLLGYVGPRHSIPYYLVATPLKEGSHICHLGDVPLCRIALKQ